MIALGGRSIDRAIVSRLADLWSLTTDVHSFGPNRALVVDDEKGIDPRFDLVLLRHHTEPTSWGRTNVVVLPPDLRYLDDGDVIGISQDGDRLAVLWRRNANINTILLTERCDNDCVMCSQPPKKFDDSYLLDRAKRLIELVPPETTAMMLSGGEPTVYGEGLIDLVSHIRTTLPEAGIHLLSNGRRFSDVDFAASWAQVADEAVMVGIPVYGAESSLHDSVVRAPGAFDETIRGILNLGSVGARIEIRVVLTSEVAKNVVSVAEFIARNLTFVDKVALMGLEMVGFARANRTEVWVDPWDYREDLADAVRILRANGLHVDIYNHQLCVLDESIWGYAVRSISDWKNRYLDECETCAVREDCGGFFGSSGDAVSNHVQAVSKVEIRLEARKNPIPSDYA